MTVFEDDKQDGRNRPKPSDSSWWIRLWEWVKALFFGRTGDSSIRETLEELIEETEGIEEPIAAHERELLKNTLELRGLIATDVMVPRADIVAVEADIPMPDLARRLAVAAHARLPVYRDNLDDILGIVMAKDVLAHCADKKPVSLKNLLRPALFVAPSMRALDLLNRMRQERAPLALVVDEYGGIDGLITLENLVEEIIGTIDDPEDIQDLPRLMTDEDGSLLAQGRTKTEEFENLVGPVLTAEERGDTDTLGGLLLSLAGRVPAKGDVFHHASGLIFEVTDADMRRIRALRIRNIPQREHRHEPS